MKKIPNIEKIEDFTRKEHHVIFYDLVNFPICYAKGCNIIATYKINIAAKDYMFCSRHIEIFHAIKKIKDIDNKKHSQKKNK